jgi:hypothetical protein
MGEGRQRGSARRTLPHQPGPSSSVANLLRLKSISAGSLMNIIKTHTRMRHVALLASDSCRVVGKSTLVSSVRSVAPTRSQITHRKTRPLSYHGLGISVLPVARIVKIRAEAATWQLISWLRQVKMQLWEVFPRESNGTVDRIELYKGAMAA